MRTVALGDVLDSATAGHWGGDPGSGDEDVRVIRNGDIKPDGIRWGELPTRGFTEREVAKSRIRPADILLTTSGECGHVAYVQHEPDDVVCATNFVRIMRFSDAVDQRWAFHYMNRLAFRAQLAPYVRGTTMKNLSTREAFPAVMIPVPSIAEQRRIAAILDAADAIRAKRRAQLAHLDDLPQAVFREIFGAPTSFQAKPLGEIATLTAGKSLVGEDLDAAAAFRVLKISAVTSGLYRPGESKPLPMGYVPPEEHIVRAGDLLMSRANTADLVGATALVVETPQYLALPDKIWRFVWRGSEIEPVYLHAFLSSAVARRKLSAMASGSGGSMKNISKAKLNRLDVPVPPLALQQEFVTKVEAIHAERARVARALEADDELFAALQHRAFRGEL